MTKYRVSVSSQKCQAYGGCLKTAPGAFQANPEGKAEVLDTYSAADEPVMAAARGCPYRAITVADAESGLQIFPRSRT
jgi:ferredoxin